MQIDVTMKLHRSDDTANDSAGPSGTRVIEIDKLT